MSYFHNGSSIEVLEENNYYPFGLKHEGYNALTGNPSYQYKYNGKELQETGMYDYGARFYMPDIGRWGVIDPLAEKYQPMSTYNYGGNNPIMMIDPNGMEIVNGESENRKNLERDYKQRESIVKKLYGGNLNMTKKDFESKNDFKDYETRISSLKETKGLLDKSIQLENKIQEHIDAFKIVDPENFDLANNLKFKDASGQSYDIDVKVVSGSARELGGASTSAAFYASPSGQDTYHSLASITTTLDFNKIKNPWSGAFAHEMGHAYNTAQFPAQTRGIRQTVDCQDPINRNSFQSKTALDWQQRFNTILMINALNLPK